MLMEDVAVSLKAVGGCDGTEINISKTCNSLTKIAKFMFLCSCHHYLNLPFLNFILEKSSQS